MARMNHKRWTTNDKLRSDRLNYTERDVRIYRGTDNNYTKVINKHQWKVLVEPLSESRFNSIDQAIRVWGASIGPMLTYKQTSLLRKWLLLDKNKKVPLQTK